MKRPIYKAFFISGLFKENGKSSPFIFKRVTISALVTFPDDTVHAWVTVVNGPMILVPLQYLVASELEDE